MVLLMEVIGRVKENQMAKKGLNRGGRTWKAGRLSEECKVNSKRSHRKGKAGR